MSEISSLIHAQEKLCTCVHTHTHARTHYLPLLPAWMLPCTSPSDKILRLWPQKFFHRKGGNGPCHFDVTFVLGGALGFRFV